jgi:cytoskeletal protein CcmA (bactofilin family)
MMWKRKDEPEPVGAPVKAANPVKEVTTVSTMPQERRPELGHEAPKGGTVAHIGKSVLVKGELSGSEDLYIDGQVEGTIELREHNLTIGPNGRVEANVNAKEVILLGTLKGNIRAAERVEIRKSGSVVGDLVAARVIIEDGAYFKGSIDIQKAGEPAPKAAEPKRMEAPSLGDIHSKFSSAPVEAKKIF